MRIDLICALLAFALSFLFCLIEIPLLKRLGAGQNILHYVKEHEGKGGTPTMGGLAFLFAAVISALIFAGVGDKPFLVAVAVGLAYMLVGFLDDLLKKKRKDNLGLRPYQKIVFQLGVGVLTALYCCLNSLTVLTVPFTRFSVDIGWGMFPLALFVLIATVNSVNLTDGLDGLAGSVSGVFFLVAALLVSLQDGDGALATLSLALAGALCAYLLFNVNRASVFMGDTGSLSLGGFASCIMLFSGNALVIPIAGIMFVLSSISVIIQVIYYKKTGKRILLMAPLHHHFQMKGYTEAKIVYAYTVVTALMGAAVLLPLI